MLLLLLLLLLLPIQVLSNYSRKFINVCGIRWKQLTHLLSHLDSFHTFRCTLQLFNLPSDLFVGTRTYYAWISNKVSVDSSTIEPCRFRSGESDCRILVSIRHWSRISTSFDLKKTGVIHFTASKIYYHYVIYTTVVIVVKIHTA